jgi:hypothetical protein
VFVVPDPVMVTDPAEFIGGIFALRETSLLPFGPCIVIVIDWLDVRLLAAWIAVASVAESLADFG